jgi:quercetin dioxygenase-like cupin family protein
VVTASAPENLRRRESDAMKILGEPAIVEPGHGTSYPAAGAETTFKVRAEDTGGMFEVTETSLPARFTGPPAHVHAELHHAFYVLESEIEFGIGGRTVRAVVGTTVFVPHGSSHRFANPSERRARMLQIDSVGGREAMFKEMSAAFPPGSKLDPPVLLEILKRYDTRPA